MLAADCWLRMPEVSARVGLCCAAGINSGLGAGVAADEAAVKATFEREFEAADVVRTAPNLLNGTRKHLLIAHRPNNPNGKFHQHKHNKRMPLLLRALITLCRSSIVAVAIRMATACSAWPSSSQPGRSSRCSPATSSRWPTSPRPYK